MPKNIRGALCLNLALAAGALLATSMAFADAPMPYAYREAIQNGYKPTLLENMAEASELFYGLRKLEGGETQCHQRAMYWSYEMFSDHRINSMKVMVFYTEKLRNTFKRDRMIRSDKPYKWWYHTAPMVYVKNEQGGVTEVVLDRTFMDAPVTLDEWTHHFVAEETLNYVDADHRHYMPRLSMKDTRCKEIGNYREYLEQIATYQAAESKYGDWIDDQKGYAGKLNGRIRAHANEPWCLVRKFPMFYMQPNSVQMMDCDPNRDAYKKPGSRLDDGRPKYPCLNYTRESFHDKWAAKDLIQAYDEVAPESEYKMIKHLFGGYAK